MVPGPVGLDQGVQGKHPNRPGNRVDLVHFGLGDQRDFFREFDNPFGV
jgi:hypothetical protein